MDILEKEKCIQIQRELIDKIQIKNIVEKDVSKLILDILKSENIFLQV